MKIPLHAECRLLSHHECGLVAVEKATGVHAHPNGSAASDEALLSLPYDSDREAYMGEGKRWYLLNRLDAPTSGVILLSGVEEVAQQVKRLFAEHKVAKTYVAAVKGIVRRNKEVWRDYIKTMRTSGVLRSAVATGPANAFAQMELLQSGAASPARCLVQLQPQTGKTHQLRVQCAHRHLPIIGDATYGDFTFNRLIARNYGHKRLFLHCAKTALKFRLGDSTVVFAAESPLPAAFSEIMAAPDLDRQL